MLDWGTVALYLILVIAGWFSIYAASYDFDQTSIFDYSGRAGKQMVWILTSLILAFILLLIESDWYDIFSFWIYVIISLLLLATIFLARDIKGSHSWLEIGPVSLQPAEFAKFATALALAKIMSAYKFNLFETHNFIKVLGLIFLPMILILLQKETGSALVFLAFFIVLYREGMSGFILFSGFYAVFIFVLSVTYRDSIWHDTPVGIFILLLFNIAIVMSLLYNYKKGRSSFRRLFPLILCLLIVSIVVSYFVSYNLCWVALAIIGFLIFNFLFLYIKYRAKHYLFILLFATCSTGFLYSVDYVFDEVLKPHQQIRIQVALGVIDDPRGAGYNVNQSKIAIGSGGVVGKGYLNGTQTKLKYVPEQDTDFIFCTIGEEKGFVGAGSVMLLFFLLIARLIFLAERQKSTFNRIYGYSVASILFFHLAINIGMVIGITPVIGIPLPFFSYGGSSLWAFTTLLFIFLRLDASRRDRL
jgi:rod shape determining protein RodA